MIILGYPGIGKSTAAKKMDKFIDIDSVFFRDRDDSAGWLGGKKGLNGYIWLLRKLNDDGKVVFGSTHKEVRERILKDEGIEKEDVVYICPKAEDKNAWISRLYNRWIDSTEMKDWYAYTRALKEYEKDIKSILEDADEGVRVIQVSEEDLEDGLALYLIRNRIIEEKEEDDEDED